VALDDEKLEISDTGIGIKQKDIDTITHRFKRANKSEGGFGIGLDIVNQVVNSYGFRLEIDSKENQGTTVRIRWTS